MRFIWIASSGFNTVFFATNCLCFCIFFWWNNIMFKFTILWNCCDWNTNILTFWSEFNRDIISKNYCLIFQISKRECQGQKDILIYIEIINFPLSLQSPKVFLQQLFLWKCVFNCFLAFCIKSEWKTDLLLGKVLDFVSLW